MVLPCGGSFCPGGGGRIGRGKVMDWSRAKTIFIITFLILNIFLGVQLIMQKNQNKFDLIKETSIEERLKADEITFPELPQEPTEGTYVEAEEKMFREDELAFLRGQDIDLSGGTTVLSTLKDPYPLKKDWQEKDANEFVLNYVYKGDEYVFGEFREDENQIIYYQTYNNFPFFKNSSGQLVLTLNNNNEIVSYRQTMLDHVKELKKQELLTAYEALVTLYNKRLLRSGNKITKVEIGYYTLVPVRSSQLLAPTWRFSVEGGDDLFVNAVEGHAFSETESKKLE
ncbi:MAG: transcriptional regulator [Caldibacillus debilis]|nr:MAG: transcriptional regulator [Caldibacillus debilis]